VTCAHSGSTKELTIMKQMFSLSELATTIEGNTRLVEDFIAPSAALSMQPDARMAIGSSETIMPILPSGHSQLGTLLKIPADYYERSRSSDTMMLAAQVNHWLGQRDPKERRMVRTLGKQVRAFLSDSYRRIDNHEVATVVLDILKRVPGLRITSTAITDSRMYIKAVSSAVEAQVKGSKRVGDVVQAGVVITNSEIGLGSLGVHGFAEFLACTNGMVRSKDGLRITHLGRKVDASIEGLLSDTTKKLEDEAVLSKVRDVITGAFNPTAFQRFIDSLSASTQEPITAPDIPAVVEALGSPVSGLGLNQTERNGVLKHLIEGGDLSKYGLVNAVTRTGQDAESYDRATELELAGFKLLEMPGRDWQRLMTQPALVAA
jgi:hypothetical protein